MQQFLLDGHSRVDMECINRCCSLHRFLACEGSLEVAPHLCRGEALAIFFFAIVKVYLMLCFDVGCHEIKKEVALHGRRVIENF